MASRHTESQGQAAPTRGVIYLHSSPAALCPHIEWALSEVLGDHLTTPLRLQWTSQPATPASLRAEYEWRGPVGSAAAIASALHGWQYLRFEVTEEPTSSSDGSRYRYTPSLGLHHSVVGVHGDLMVHENRITAALEREERGMADLADLIAEILGLAWDEELEPFRHAGDGGSVRWLHQTG
jgi:hypothetical protein